MLTLTPAPEIEAEILDGILGPAGPFLYNIAREVLLRRPKELSVPSDVSFRTSGSGRPWVCMRWDDLSVNLIDLQDKQYVNLSSSRKGPADGQYFQSRRGWIFPYDEIINAALVQPLDLLWNPSEEMPRLTTGRYRW